MGLNIFGPPHGSKEVDRNNFLNNVLRNQSYAITPKQKRDLDICIERINRNWIQIVFLSVNCVFFSFSVAAGVWLETGLHLYKTTIWFQEIFNNNLSYQHAEALQKALTGALKSLQDKSQIGAYLIGAAPLGLNIFLNIVIAGNLSRSTKKLAKQYGVKIYTARALVGCAMVAYYETSKVYHKIDNG